MRLPDRVVQLFERQHGVAARRQLLDHLSPGSVDGHVRRGSLARVGPGIYRVRGAALSHEARAMAAVLQAGPASLLAGPFVLGLQQLGDFAAHHRFEVLTPRPRRLTSATFTHRVAPRPAPASRRVAGLPVVGVTDALITTGRFVDEVGARAVRAAYDQARWRRLTTETEVVRRAGELGRRHPGAAFFLDLLAAGTLRPESEPERRLGALLSRFDPAPKPQVWVLPHRRVDYYWHAFRLGTEYLGEVDHAFAEARLQDEDRIRELREVGVRIVPVVNEDLVDARRFLGWMHALLVTRAVELGVSPPRAVVV